MTPDPVTVTGDTSSGGVARILGEHHFKGIPVVDEAGRVIGVVSETDLLVKTLREDDLRSRLDVVTNRSREERRRHPGGTAADIVTREPITVPEQMPVTELARLMLRQEIHRLSLVRDGRCVGIVTRNDVLKVFSRADGETALDLRDDVVEDLWIDPHRLRIRLADGVVTLQGEVQGEIEQGLITEAARTPA
ncbi:MAG TPA: CBS domain-containing protein [Actinomycetota bacterium]|nr:CBS domain-containing protein [Actinomycetota bacterium]